MVSDPIFLTLDSHVLDQITQYLKWDPLFSTSPAKLLSQCYSKEREAWLDAHRAELERHISWVGTPIFSYALGNAKSYHQIVSDVAAQVGVPVCVSMSTTEAETALVQKLWTDTLSRLSEAERNALLAKVQAIATQYGTSAKKEIVGFAGLAAAQMSGFGVYVLGSTLLGALNSALGLGLGFGAFTGLSSAISIVIGPIGWAALGLYTIKNLGAPNYKKLLPVVILIASQRGGARGPAHELTAAVLPPPPVVASTASVFTNQSEDILGIFETDTHGPRLGKRPVSAVDARRYSKAEKTSFQLLSENRALCQITAEIFPEMHFLDLSEEDQQIIREMRTEREQAEEEQKRIFEQREAADRKEARKRRKREEREERAAKKQSFKTGASVAKRAKDYSRLLRNLEFAPEAVERLELLASKGAIYQVDEKLGLMNVGQVLYHDSITGTHPPICEDKAGYDYRIYYQRNGSKLRICLVGDKGTQEDDIAQLKRKTPSHAAGA